jgi:hypothetical protein
MNTTNDPRSKRMDFLIEVYKQMMADINRHIVVVWQSIGVVIGSFTIMGLVDKQVLSIDIAASLIIIICSWALALLLDSSYWYNRNLGIIANIEKIFLDPSDLKNVHYYFGKHRPKNRMITTLRVQVALSLGIGLLVLIYHFLVQVLPGFKLSISRFDPRRALPYVVALIAGVLIIKLKKKRIIDYDEFLKNSPGLQILTEGIEYGGGHGFKKREIGEQTRRD